MGRNVIKTATMKTARPTTFSLLAIIFLIVSHQGAFAQEPAKIRVDFQDKKTLFLSVGGQFYTSQSVSAAGPRLQLRLGNHALEGTYHFGLGPNVKDSDGNNLSGEKRGFGVAYRYYIPNKTKALFPYVGIRMDYFHTRPVPALQFPGGSNYKAAGIAGLEYRMPKNGIQFFVEGGLSSGFAIQNSQVKSKLNLSGSIGVGIPLLYFRGGK